MKKILKFFIAVLALLTLYSCVKDEPQELAVPTNVTISEEGYISWDKVENATSYIVTINEKSYVVTTNNFQVEDLKNDFKFTVKALADGYITSPDSDVQDFTGTAAADKQEMTDYVVAVMLGTKEEATDKDTYDKQAQLLQIACSKAYEYGVDVDTLKTVIDPIVEIENKDAQTIILSLLISSSSLDKEQIVGMTVFADYYAQIFLDGIKSLFTDERIAKMVDDTTALLLRNDCEIAIALGHIFDQVANAYNKLQLKTIPQILKLLTEGSFKNNPKLVVEIKSSIVETLLDNQIADEDLAVVLTFVKDMLPILEPLVENANYKGISIKDLFNELEEAFMAVDINELAKIINEKAVDLLNSLDFITEELLTEAFKYENNVQTIVYIVLNKLKDEIPTFDFTGQNLINIAELIYKKLPISSSNPEATIKDLLGLADDDYNVLGDNVAKLINNLLNILGDFVKDDGNIENIVKAFNFSYNESVIEGEKELWDIEVDSDEYIQKVMTEYEIASADKLELNTPYVFKSTSKVDNTVVIKSLTIIVLDYDEDWGDVTYSYNDTTITITSLSDLLPLVDALVDALKEQSSVTSKDIQEVLQVLVKTTIIPEGTAEQFLTIFASAPEADVQAVYDDLLVVVKAFVNYVQEIKAEEFVYEIGSDNYNVVYGFFTTENGALVKTLVNDLATLLDNAKAFPLTIVLGEGLETTFETKDQMVKTFTDMIDGLIESNTPITEE